MQLWLLQRWDEGVFMNTNGNKTAFTDVVLSSYQILLNLVLINGANNNFPCQLVTEQVTTVVGNMPAVVKAIKDKIDKNFPGVVNALDSIRSDLNFFDKSTAKESVHNLKFEQEQDKQKDNHPLIYEDDYSIINHQTEDEGNEQLWTYTLQESNMSHNINDYLRNFRDISLKLELKSLSDLRYDQRNRIGVCASFFLKWKEVQMVCAE
ncbi:hypothetical protein BD770DRAFT_414636 [Pilaira anomala]|nr:hypothetical protein BD770DRAFT_414636 [Pilaira anomala]